MFRRSSVAARLRAALALAVVVPAALFGLASPASAGYWSDKCGAGYGLVDTVQIQSGTYGEVRVFTKVASGTRYWCAITIRKGAWYGKKGWTYVGMQKSRDGAWTAEGNNFYYYAGPVRFASNNGCVWIKGTVGYNGVSYTTRNVSGGQVISVCV
jgi:hypothetical protein